jgi:hypothetical protein
MTQILFANIFMMDFRNKFHILTTNISLVSDLTESDRMFSHGRHVVNLHSTAN